MKIVGVILLGAIVFCSFTFAAQAPPEKRHGILSVLKVGEAVMVQDRDGMGPFQITLIDNVPGVLGHKVIEVGADYVVVEDVTGVNEIRIPVYSLKGIFRLKKPTGK